MGAGNELTGVFHLVHAGNPLEPVARFVSSWEAHPPGAKHRLYFLLKGFGNRVPLQLRAILDRIPHERITVPDAGYDIGVYVHAARAVPATPVLFMNSFSVIQSSDWLAKLLDAYHRPQVGMVGASGSWESPASFYLNRQDRHREISVTAALDGLRDVAVGTIASALFPAFPNAHLRTNAFMLGRDDFLAMRPRFVRTKLDAWMFESGRHSLTKRVMRRGLRVLVVGRDGRSYEPRDWDSSHTYCNASQENLLIHDNRTLAYQVGDDTFRKIRRWASWNCVRTG